MLQKTGLNPQPLGSSAWSTTCGDCQAPEKASLSGVEAGQKANGEAWAGKPEPQGGEVS